jgi:hypothetical protein
MYTISLDMHCQKHTLREILLIICACVNTNVRWHAYIAAAHLVAVPCELVRGGAVCEVVLTIGSIQGDDGLHSQKVLKQSHALHRGRHRREADGGEDADGCDARKRKRGHGRVCGVGARVMVRVR